MQLSSAADIPLLVVSDNSRSERRISPSWTLQQLRARLEPITGIPASCQRLSVKLSPEHTHHLHDLADDVQLASLNLHSHVELHVGDSRPPGLRENYTDVSAVKKYEMPKDEYEARSDTVLAWKKTQKLGRFDPDAPTIEQQKIQTIQREIEERGITVGARCRLTPDSDARRGKVEYIGDVPELPGLGFWVGVVLDEPTGKNDGAANGVRYFECKPNFGVFVRPERLEVGNFPPVDDFEDEEF
ncbi:tubulin-specific chaperone-like protein B [Myriangium duriaei CBS 260.36]|uniref:Tubulin-specific chaperone-like protein B n=1 Tax=Myriangium duriaei CBS 260.36 TaxID=1168546 RepID=A0A9P4JBW5_9PEZI|nr:tubulin-specific chaperone-like protein B [Myriangium duriaei CBS 260.36]